jgi:hypothetical protein
MCPKCKGKDTWWYGLGTTKCNYCGYIGEDEEFNEVEK